MGKFKIIFLSLSLFFLINNSLHAQTSKVWATLNDETSIPYFSSDGNLISNDSVFNHYIDVLNITSFVQALPSSKKKELQKVYEIACNCDQYELLNTLKNNVPVLEGIYPAPKIDTLHTPNDYAIQPGVNNYALNLINAQSAWDLTKGDSNVVIAISDQGYDSFHTELIGKYVHFFSGSNFPTHGNAVAVIAAGNTNNNFGLSSIGYNCKMGLYYTGFNEILSAAYSGARIINMSWASSCFFNPYQQQCIDEAYEAGAFLVAAAGNGNTCTYPSAYVYPAAYNHVFSVTSIGANDNHEQIPNDTTSTHQHNNMVDLSAPGYDVTVNPLNGWYINGSGTSWAAPMVSGTIGLMLSINPCLSRIDIDTILKLSSVNIDSLNPSYAGKIGAGRLNAYAAVQMSAGWATQPMVVNLQPMNISSPAGGTVQFSVSSSSSLPLYQWQRDSSGVFVDIYNNNFYSGAKTSTLTVSGIPVSFNNQQYRCVMTSGYCQATSNSATLLVNGVVLPEDAGPIHGDTTLCYGDTTVFAISAVNYASGYNWTINGNANIISGQNTNSLTLQIFDTAVTVSVTPVNAYGTGNSSTFSANVFPMPTGFLTGNPVICMGDSATLTMNVTGQGPWFGLINDSINFSGITNPIQIVVHPDTTTSYVLQELHTLDGCAAFPDYLSSTASVTVLPYLRDTIATTICTNQLPYQWNAINVNSSGFYSDTISNSTGCDSIVTLQVSVIAGNAPTTPLTITQTLVDNTCFARIYRYTASITNNTTGYQWIIPASCGGISPVTIDSGDINSSRVIRLKYFSNNAASLTDSIKVSAYNNCGNSLYKSAKLINTLLSLPSAPTSIVATSLVTNVCGQRKVRYTAPNLPLGASGVVAATGYLWSFSSPTPLMAQLDSGTLTSKIIVVKYLSNNAAQVGDSIYLQYASACGFSSKKSLKINLAALNPPVAPASITITPLVVSTCGQRTYRCSMPLMPTATTTSGAATGYLWSFTGNLINYATIDSGTITSRIIVVKYTDNNATVLGDSIKARYNSDCGFSNFRALKFSVPKLSPPSAPASILISLVKDSCGARIYRYTAPALPTATTTVTAANGYEWSLPTGSAVATSASLDSGLMSGAGARYIRLKYTNNGTAIAGDSIRVRYTSGCGASANKAQKLSNIAATTLAASATLTGTTSICSIVGTLNSTRYTATAVTGAVSYLWTLPAGAVIDSGSNGLKIRVRFITAGSNDSIFVQAIGANGCAGTKKVLKLITTGCATLPSSRVQYSSIKINEDNMDVILYPNPTSSAYQMFVKSSKLSQIVNLRIIDLQGRLIKSLTFNTNEMIAFGNELKPGVYMVVVSEGEKVKTLRVVKY